MVIEILSSAADAGGTAQLVWRMLFFALIPVLVTGIQRRRVCGAEEYFQPKDLG
ncbi:hypothetical protein I6F07_06955 [Ensifer sp. IC4062]|nr:hypothetical protein [Ensifer sp. IC4062]MCA1439966.1 hypothetical protein [Ensifer sp. IC4062]